MPTHRARPSLGYYSILYKLLLLRIETNWPVDNVWLFWVYIQLPTTSDHLPEGDKPSIKCIASVSKARFPALSEHTHTHGSQYTAVIPWRLQYGFWKSTWSGISHRSTVAMSFTVVGTGLLCPLLVMSTSIVLSLIAGIGKLLSDMLIMLFQICCLETQFLFYSQNRKEVGDWLDALNSAIS